MPLSQHNKFSTKSDLYASARPRYPEALFKYLMTLCPDLERAWDCGTGSGQAATSLGPYFQQVEATDVSPEQISHAHMTQGVTYTVQPAEATTFPADYFSLVTVAQALHWFDLEKFWPEVQRVLKPGGIFAAWTYSWFQVSPELDIIIKAELLNTLESYWAPQNRLVWHGYQTISFPFTELTPPEIVFCQAWNLVQLLSYLGTWSATKNYIAAQGDDGFNRLVKTLAQAWGDWQITRTVSMDFYLRVGRYEPR